MTADHSKLRHAIPSVEHHENNQPGLSGTTQDYAEPHQLSDARRDAMIRSIVSSQALASVELTYGEAAELVDCVFNEPLADIG